MMGGFQAKATGFYGKLPAKGDFLRFGLPEACVAALDVWCRECLISSRDELGANWQDIWMRAPIWRFLLPQGACGPLAVLGIWLPSMDKVGRLFPFMLCALADRMADLEQGGAWLQAAEAVGLAAVVEDMPPECIAQTLQMPFTATAAAPPGWWTEGSPLVAAQRREDLSLLPASDAAAMLRDKAVVPAP